MQPTKLETYHETRYVKEVTDDGAKCLKTGFNGYPDRLTLLDCNLHFFIEFKREGEVPRKLQLHRIKELRELGHNVYICESYQEAITIYNRYKAKCKSKRINKAKTLRSAIHKPSSKKQVRRSVSSPKPW